MVIATSKITPFFPLFSSLLVRLFLCLLVPKRTRRATFCCCCSFADDLHYAMGTCSEVPWRKAEVKSFTRLAKGTQKENANSGQQNQLCHCVSNICHSKTLSNCFKYMPQLWQMASRNDRPKLFKLFDTSVSNCFR